MHCVECNTNNEQRKFWKNKFCPCCGNKKNISFHRYVQYRIGDVCWLNSDGSDDASVSEMNMRCNRIILDCYKKLNKKVNRTWNNFEGHSKSPSDVTNFFAMQFLGNDCKSKSNF